jgi:hypothetical protein
VFTAMRMLAGALAATLLGGSVPLRFAQAQDVRPQLALEQVQPWCFQNGQPGCQGEWLQVQSDRVQFSASRCDTVFILPSVVRQSTGTNRTRAVVVIDSIPPELLASARRSGNVRVLTDVCMIALEAS